MPGISKKALFGKLNKLGYESIEGAHRFCALRENPLIELSHWFYIIFQLQDSDLHKIIKHFGIDESRLSKDILESIESIRGNASAPNISDQITKTVERAWVYGSLELSDYTIRTGHLIIGILETNDLTDSLYALSAEFRKINNNQLIQKFSTICERSPEAKTSQPATSSTALMDKENSSDSDKSALQSYASNLTESARNNEIDPVVGRDDEIRQIIDVLMRRRQNNPILTGEAGVGKTAVVEGFARRIASEDVPPDMKEVEVYSLDMGALQAGASMKGEFEARLKKVIEEVQASEKPIILFIDEAHTLIGAGGATGTGDAANLLKPALARGTLRTIAATTWAEYKKYFEKDPALTRRFQVIQIQEPDETKATQMMRCLAPVMEKHHKVLILDEALEASVSLSHRYIPARQLPDKSISVLDTACARVAISQHATPAHVEDHQKQLEMYQAEHDIIKKEAELGIDIGKRLDKVNTHISNLKDQLETLKQQWDKEKTLVNRIVKLREQLTPNNDSTTSITNEDKKKQQPQTDTAQIIDELRQLQTQLTTLQSDSPLVLPTVNEQAIATIIADWTGIPVGRMVKNEINTVLQLGKTLGKRVIGQQHSLELLAQRIRTSRAGLESPDKPIGVFMLCGPSGVGKTETALALAETLYGGEESLITINMSEFQEAHTISTLKGSPPGYVGYGEGGILTEAVRRRPHSIVLLDEVEKAHPDVHEMFFQVFDKGSMEDAEGRHIDFRNTIILLTSNAGSDITHKMCDGVETEQLPKPEVITKAIRPALRDIFPAALLGRLDVIPYYPLNSELLQFIIALKLAKIEKRIKKTYDIPFTYDPSVAKLIGERCTEVESGARVVDSIISNNLLPKIGKLFLENSLGEDSYESVHVDVDDKQFIYQFINN